MIKVLFNIHFKNGILTITQNTMMFVKIFTRILNITEVMQNTKAKLWHIIQLQKPIEHLSLSFSFASKIIKFLYNIHLRNVILTILKNILMFVTLQKLRKTLHPNYDTQYNFRNHSKIYRYHFHVLHKKSIWKNPTLSHKNFYLSICMRKKKAVVWTFFIIIPVNFSWHLRVSAL